MFAGLKFSNKLIKSDKFYVTKLHLVKYLSKYMQYLSIKMVRERSIKGIMNILRITN